MLRRILFGFLWSIPSFAAGVALGLGLVYLFSSNHHDLSMEAGMTAAFITGPIAALIGFMLGAILARPKSPPAPRQP